MKRDVDGVGAGGRGSDSDEAAGETIEPLRIQETAEEDAGETVEGDDGQHLGGDPELHQEQPGAGSRAETLYDEALLTPYVTRSGKRFIPVMKYQAGVGPSVSELKHKYELFLQKKQQRKLKLIRNSKSEYITVERSPVCLHV